jgi:hypothetical protein
VPVLVMLCMADLIDSLQTSQDFLRRDSLSCACGGRFRSSNRLNEEERSESHALSRRPMTLVVLATTVLLACGFYIYVLCQWMRDTNGKRTPRSRIDGQSEGKQENKRLYVIGSRKIAESQDRSDIASRRAPSITWLSGRRGLDWNESERIAFRRITDSLSSRKRS